MTLPPKQIGDKGQQFEVRYSTHVDADDYKVIGWSTTRDGAEHFAEAWRLRHDGAVVWIVDRWIPHGGDGVAA